MAKQKKVMNVKGFEDLLAKQTGRAVRPYRADGYVNLLNKYGTQQDTTEHYHYREEPVVPDDYLTSYYEGNGLFAKIIDAPAEEAIKHGFSLKIKDDDIENFYTSALDELDWEEQAMTAIKWARLFGGSIIVMLINDGRGLDEPLDWKNIKSIDDIRVYDRSLIQEDTSSMFTYTPNDPFRTRSSRLGMPEYYDVYSMYGNFRVHESRCLVFQNGILPENTTNSVYQMWGMPEYVRINKAIRDAEVAHGSAVKLLDRSIQAVYKMQGLADEVATEEGEDRVLKRLQTIDMARGMLNTITIDADGEDYDFRTFQFSGVSDVIECTCNYLSALTNIPQTILFGRSPAGMNATGTSDLENWYNYVERIQSRMVKKNLRYLLSIVFQAGVACGEVDEVPDINIEFNPLWSLSELEQAQLDQTKAATQQTRAQTAQIYMDAQVIDPSEVRKKLADSDEFDVESMLDEYDNDEDLFANMPQGNDMGGDMSAMMGGMGGMMPQGMPQDAPEGSGSPADYSSEANIEEHNTDPGTVGDAPTAAPAATKLPQDMSPEEIEQAEDVKKNIKKDSANFDAEPASWISTEKGEHIPLNGEGTAIGGPLEGRDFSKAKSRKNANAAAKRAPVNGKDISSSYKGEKNLSSIIKAQGFDGLPQIVKDDEFDAIAAESDFIAQRIYTATTQEILDEYQNQLYNGEFRVDCNGAAYGYGMYCASADGTEVTDRIKQEMLDYKNDNENRLRDAVEKEVTATLTPEDLCNTDAAKQAKLTKKEAAAFLEYQTVDDYDTDLMTPENKKVINNLMKDDNKYNAAYGALYSLTDDKVYSYSYPSTTETLTLDKSAKVASYNEIADEARNAGYYDTSAYAALKGYDAINIERMYGSDYTIVLNRTKCVFKNGAMATDAKDKGKITFEAEKNGRIIKALRNGKVIGYVMVEGSNDKKNNDGGPGNPGSGNHGHAGVPGAQGGSAPQGAADSAASYERITKLKDNFSKLSTDMQTLYIQQTGAIPKNEEAELLQGVENGDENAIKRFKEISDAYFDMAEYSREPKEIGVEMRDWLLTQDEETRVNFFNDSMNRQFSPDEREWCNTDSDAQKLAIDLGMSGNTPQVVSEDDFNKFIEESGATPMYRGVKNLDDMSAENIQYQTLYDTEKFYMGSGIYGDGLYFSDDTHTAKGYSNGGSEILTAALRPDAKVIDSNSDELKEAREKLGCFTPIHNAEAALYLGYDAIRVSDMDYTVVLNRSAMIVKDNCDYMAVGALDNI